MAKKMNAQDKKAVEDRLKRAAGEVGAADQEVSALRPLPNVTPPEYTAEVPPDPGGKPCGKLYDARDDIEIALIGLGGRPCGGGKPC